MARAKRDHSPKWKHIEWLLSRLKDTAWEPLPARTKSAYTIVGYMKARNYLVTVLKSLTFAEVQQFDEMDIREMFMYALYNQDPNYGKNKSPRKGRRRG